MIEFAEDWLMHEAPLGEGAYGEVKLLVNKRTRDKVACKIINYKEDSNAECNIQKEVLIHRSLSHENIIRYLGRRKETLKQYIYLEYAAQGELFQLIEPDIGMPSGLSQSYMKQLLSGIQYLHSRGVVHRDIKPENLLINSEGVLKISDFGMATIFRCRGKERLLDRRCGTRPYLAPEVLDRPYKGPPADIWSCGIVLIAMLTGELPWSDTVSPEFQAFSEDKYITLTPWSKLGNSTLSLVRKILAIDPEKRFTIEAILKHPWMKFNFENDSQESETDGVPSNPAKRWNSMLETETRIHRELPDVALSQPNLKPSSFEQLINAVNVKKDSICFSQPIHNEDLYLGSQIQFTQTKLTLETFNKLIKRMTRFYVTSNREKTLEMLCSVLDTIHYSWRIDPSGAVTVSTADTNKNDLVFKANIIDMEGRILVDFRLMKGCGINFKRKFIKLKTCLGDIIDIDN